MLILTSLNIVKVKFCFLLLPVIVTLQETNISPKNGILKMIFLFPMWDMLIPWRVLLLVAFRVFFLSLFVTVGPRESAVKLQTPTRCVRISSASFSSGSGFGGAHGDSKMHENHHPNLSMPIPNGIGSFLKLMVDFVDGF